MVPRTTTREPLIKDSATCSACSAHTVTGKKVVSPSAHSPDEDGGGC